MEPILRQLQSQLFQSYVSYCNDAESKVILNSFTLLNNDLLIIVRDSSTEFYEMVKVAGILATIVLTIIEPTTWSGHACSYSILVLIIFLSFGVGFWGLHLHFHLVSPCDSHLRPAELALRRSRCSP